MQCAAFTASAVCARVAPQQQRSQRQNRQAAARLVVRAEEAAAAAPAPAAKAPWSPPQLDSNIPAPIFGGSTGQ